MASSILCPVVDEAALDGASWCHSVPASLGLIFEVVHIVLPEKSKKKKTVFFLLWHLFSHLNILIIQARI